MAMASSSSAPGFWLRGEPVVELQQSPDFLQALVAELAAGCSVEDVSSALAESLQMAFPQATSVSLQHTFGPGCLMSVGNFKHMGRCTALLLHGEDCLAGACFASQSAVSCSIKQDRRRWSDLQYAREEGGATCLISVPIVMDPQAIVLPFLLQAARAPYAHKEGGSSATLLDTYAQLTSVAATAGCVTLGFPSAVDALDPSHFSNLLLLAGALAPCFESCMGHVLHDLARLHGAGVLTSCRLQGGAELPLIDFAALPLPWGAEEEALERAGLGGGDTYLGGGDMHGDIMHVDGGTPGGDEADEVAPLQEQDEGGSAGHGLRTKRSTSAGCRPPQGRPHDENDLGKPPALLPVMPPSSSGTTGGGQDEGQLSDGCWPGAGELPPQAAEHESPSSVTGSVGGRGSIGSGGSGAAEGGGGEAGGGGSAGGTAESAVGNGVGDGGEGGEGDCGPPGRAPMPIEAAACGSGDGACGGGNGGANSSEADIGLVSSSSGSASGCKLSPAATLGPSAGSDAGGLAAESSGGSKAARAEAEVAGGFAAEGSGDSGSICKLLPAATLGPSVGSDVGGLAAESSGSSGSSTSSGGSKAARAEAEVAGGFAAEGNGDSSKISGGSGSSKATRAEMEVAASRLGQHRLWLNFLDEGTEGMYLRWRAEQLRFTDLVSCLALIWLLHMCLREPWGMTEAAPVPWAAAAAYSAVLSYVYLFKAQTWAKYRDFIGMGTWLCEVALVAWAGFPRATAALPASALANSQWFYVLTGAVPCLVWTLCHMVTFRSFVVVQLVSMLCAARNFPLLCAKCAPGAEAACAAHAWLGLLALGALAGGAACYAYESVSRRAFVQHRLRGVGTEEASWAAPHEHND